MSGSVEDEYEWGVYEEYRWIKPRYYLRLTVLRKKSIIRTLTTNDDWFKFFCPDKVYYTLSVYLTILKQHENCTITVPLLLPSRLTGRNQTLRFDIHIHIFIWYMNICNLKWIVTNLIMSRNTEYSFINHKSFVHDTLYIFIDNTILPAFIRKLFVYKYL